MDIRIRLHNLVDGILGEDPRAALIAFHELHDAQMPWLEQRVVALARRERWSWARIARLLGRSRQDVHKRLRTITPALPHDPYAEYRRWELETQRWRAGRRLATAAAIAIATNPDNEAIPW